MFIYTSSFFETFASTLEVLDNLLWGYAALPFLLAVGAFLTYKSRFVQIRRFPQIISSFFQALVSKHEGTGVHPLKAFFTCIGGSMGIGNVVAVCTAAQIGGPGALFWIWVTALIGMIVKYSEVYLGVKYSVADGKGGFKGGPMYFLQKAYKSTWAPKIVCLLLCIYGVEIYQFSVITENISVNFNANKYIIALILISLMIAISRKGVHHVGRLTSFFIPIFIILYLGMSGWVFAQNITMIPSMLSLVMQSAFTGHAAVGAFAGSSIMIAASQGIRRTCYAGDVASGYASVIHSQTGAACPEKQASFAIIEIFLDSFVICTTSVMLVLITGVWNSPMEASMLVQNALADYFPGMQVFMPLFLLVLGFTAIISYFCAGIKCAEFLSAKVGRRTYYVYASCASLMFVCLETSQALTIMSINAALLLLLNLYGIYKLRDEIGFSLADHPPPKAVAETIIEQVPSSPA